MKLPTRIVAKFVSPIRYVWQDTQSSLSCLPKVIYDLNLPAHYSSKTIKQRKSTDVLHSTGKALDYYDDGKKKLSISFRVIEKHWKEFCIEVGSLVFVNSDTLKLIQSLKISSKVLKQASTQFYNLLLANELTFITRKQLFAAFLMSKNIFASLVVGAFLKYLALYYTKESRVLDILVKEASFSRRHYEFIEARNLSRVIIAHLGPTNSGKTHSALERLKLAKSGIYCGPLRLLAHEVYEKLNKQDILCNLLTGEEKREISGAEKWSSTIEMAQFERSFDVAVIDEIQMIGDLHRGWAWTNALFGIQAKEIHVCGDPAVESLLKNICEKTGDQLVIHRYDRLAGLSMESKEFGKTFRKLKRGDCIVAFSRRKLFALKNQIESVTNFKVAIIYGSLPPETRAEQARLFNEGVYDVLVASDAIGMGLNLNIRRIIFQTLSKFDGEKTILLEPAHLKQIAGRAGRFGSEFPNGLVGAFSRSDMKIIKYAIESASYKVESSVMSPTERQLEIFADVLPDLSFSDILTIFQAIASLESDQSLCKLDDQRRLADLIETLPFSIADRFRLIGAPVKVRDEASENAFVFFAECIAAHRMAHINDVLKEVSSKNTHHVLSQLESNHQIIVLYIWLRYPQILLDRVVAISEKERLESKMNEILQTMSFGTVFEPESHETIHDLDNVSPEGIETAQFPYIPPPTQQ